MLTSTHHNSKCNNNALSKGKKRASNTKEKNKRAKLIENKQHEEVWQGYPRRNALKIVKKYTTPNISTMCQAKEQRELWKEHLEQNKTNWRRSALKRGKKE